MPADVLTGTGDPPLEATRSYSFRRATGTSGAPTIVIPVLQRGSWDDFGAVEHLEQEAFFELLVKRLGVVARSGYPGEWYFDDAEREVVWRALSAALRPLAAATPSSAPSPR